MPLPFPELEKIAEPKLPDAAAGTWWWYALAVVLGLVALGIIIGMLVVLARRAAVPGLPSRPEKLALKELKALRRRAEALDGPAFGVALGEVVRTFLHRRLGMPARFSTTEELLGRTRRPDEPPPPPAMAAFAPVLEGCDALKFSSAGAATRAALLEAAESALKSVSAAPPPQILTVLPSLPDAPPA